MVRNEVSMTIYKQQHRCLRLYFEWERAQLTIGWDERVGIAMADSMVTALDTRVTLEVAAENEMDITS